MIRTVALLGLVAFASASIFDDELWKDGLSYAFPSFLPLPRNSSAAEEKGWTMVSTRPARTYSSGFDGLILWVNPNDTTLGILVDEYGKTSGLQIAIPSVGLTPYYDMREQGATYWNYTNVDGQTEVRWTWCIYFVSEDEETRKASSNKTQLLPEDAVVVEGNNGELTKIATNLTNLDIIWTEQACVPLMGLHYYYNMTETLGCDKPFFPWFPLWDKKTTQLIGIGFMSLGSSNSTTLEHPGETAVQLIVKTAPKCMLELVSKYGAFTQHIYFIDQPGLISCI